MNPIIKKSRLIQTNGFVSGQTLINFIVPDELKQGDKKTVFTKAIQVFSTANLSAIGGITPFTAANLLNLTLTLKGYKDKKSLVIDLPSTALIRSSNGGYYYMLDNLVLDWATSFIKVQDSTGLTVNSAFVLEVVYDEVTI